MARKEKVKTVTPQQEIHLPDVKSRRLMLNNALTEIQTQGYAANINLVVATSQRGQKVGVPDGRGGQMLKDKRDHLKDLEETVDNSKRAATAIVLELKRLPVEPEPEEPEPDEPDIQPDHPAEGKD